MNKARVYVTDDGPTMLIKDVKKLIKQRIKIIDENLDMAAEDTLEYAVNELDAEVRKVERMNKGILKVAHEVTNKTKECIFDELDNIQRLYKKSQSKK